MKNLMLAMWVFWVFLLPNAKPSGSSIDVIAKISAKQANVTSIARSRPIESSRGYQTTPEELREIARKADLGVEPYASAVREVVKYANRPWNFYLAKVEYCGDSDSPRWNDNSGGTPVLLAKAMAFHLTGEELYAIETKGILERIMTEVEVISDEIPRCELTFGWGTPELVSAADLIESVFSKSTCTGPESTRFGENKIIEGNCKELFQNWLVKNPYYIISLTAEESVSNWGAAGTNSIAHIADYLWDRPEVEIIHRVPASVYSSDQIKFSPSEAFTRANELMLDRMNGYRVGLRSLWACDDFGGTQQRDSVEYFKSQITERGIIPDDARRSEFCNIFLYNGSYQNYPQIHLGNNIQQCELMLRRGDSSCFDNVDWRFIPVYEFIDQYGNLNTTQLYPGRGSIEKAIKAIIVDSGTEWHHDSALEIAYRYYFNHRTQPGFYLWFEELLDDRPLSCSQDVCFGALTHGFGEDETPSLPPMIPPP